MENEKRLIKSSQIDPRLSDGLRHEPRKFVRKSQVRLAIKVQKFPYQPGLKLKEQVKKDFLSKHRLLIT